MNTSLNKKDKLRIVFMGTPEFAVTILDKLIQNDYDVVGVITSPDKPAGRGRKINKSAVKKYAESKGLNIIQPANLKAEDFLEELAALNANLQIVVAFRMLPRAVWEMPKYGTFNLHASLLPDYRGAAPINWAIINGETETGVTTFFIDDKIDTGEMVLQEKIGIGADDSAGDLHDKLMHLGADLVMETAKQIQNGNVVRTKQTFSDELRSAPKIHKNTCKIDWGKPGSQIYNHIRGLSPYPGSWTTLTNDGEEIFIKIYKVTKEEEKHGYNNGQIIFGKKEMKVAVKDGFINLLEIQLPGKRRMDIRDVLNGLKLSKSASMA
ncbi:methionyl-tRNA formyltransferase [Maribacter sp. HTCC2170]|uniref:methionyl-tRNA formyltransferase n=1 Tax=Maribacter sp. (strain HTCC2170 / KCCM 42371) TaxID=313603 RepID=UPI00006BB844|nr:methionyl-tRNA formyltransferase [Maribacter sp. HTCC2170]EAQ99713.1 methionyl-tRNA formyltransferase [Maribacter sp. HTCC2170]